MDKNTESIFIDVGKSTLKTSSTVLIDGGLSTALESIGVTLNIKLWSGALLRTKGDRDLIRAAHRLFADAGAKVLITSSY